jgi:DNA-binding response OmpR family regulator
MQILVAEDDPIARELLEMLLREWGYEVTLACDGAEAWEALQKPKAPPLIILDWMMPGLNGVEVCRNVRGLQAEVHPYIILLTGKEAEKNLVVGMSAGADAYVTKPVGPEELRVLVRQGQRIVEMQTELLAAKKTLHAQVEILRKEMR